MKFLREIILLLILLLAAGKTYRRVDVGIIDFETGMSFFFAFAAAFILLISLLTRVLKTNPQKQRFIFTQAVILFVLLFGFELALRQMGSFATYGESNGEPNYYSPFSSENRNSWYYLHEPNLTISYQKAEFDWNRTTNSWGMCEAEIPMQKPPGEFRILALGDSFTEGDGVAYDSTWLKTLEYKLSERHPHLAIRTINAGIGGSDPVYQYVLLKDSLLPLKPDLVIVSTNASDISDVSTRGGMERFQADGKVKVIDPPAWEWIYASSHLARLMICRIGGYSIVLDLDKQHPKNESPALIAQAMGDIEHLGKENHFKTLAVIHPVVQELFPNGITPEPHMDALRALLAQKSIQMIDLEPAYVKLGYTTAEKMDQIYWPQNRHFNALGYRLYGELVADWIEELDILPKTEVLLPPSGLLD